jgi:putative ATP-dependent endonuclease of the OLD family
MPIIVDRVRISGFRGIRNFEMSLPRIAVLIGPNNCGKTSVLKALQLALGDYGRHLSDEDFHIDDKDDRSEDVTVDIRIIATNEKEERVKSFAKEWANEFGDKIQADPAGNQFLAFRTTAKPQPAKTGFLVERYTLLEWVDFSDWTSVVPSRTQKFSARSEFVPYISIDAQRDIHKELNEKSSFVGRVLSQVKYDKTDVDTLEKMISDINDEAVAKSVPLARLKDHLDSLNDSFGGGGSAEVTPFPKKLRDLSKNFSVHFGNSAASSFPMEYHGWELGVGRLCWQ